MKPTPEQIRSALEIDPDLFDAVNDPLAERDIDVRGDELRDLYYNNDPLWDNRWRGPA